MRLNRGTIALLLIAIVVIVGAIVLNNNQAAAPGAPTATPSTPTGSLFEGLTDSNRVVSLEVQNNLTAARTVLTRGGDNVWVVEATNGHDYPVDQDKSNSAVTSLMGLQYDNSFDDDQLANFGLAQPGYTITLRTDDGGVYTMHVGDDNPAGNRYYVVTEVTPGSGIPPTEEATAAMSTPETESTAEVEETAEATAEKTPEANSRIAAAPAKQEATEAAGEATEAATPEATAEATEAATPEATEAATAAPTPTIEPLVNLSGRQTVRLVTKNVINTITALVDEPPYIVPTDTPTPLPTANPYSEVDQTATAAVQQTATMDVLLSTLQARQTATAAAITPTATPQP